MNLLKKAAVAVAALSMVASPVAASAAPSFDGLRVDASMDDANAFGGGSSWILLLLAGAAVVAGIVIAADGGNSSPTSP